jgi:hypothetical protein
MHRSFSYPPQFTTSQDEGWIDIEGGPLPEEVSVALDKSKASAKPSKTDEEAEAFWDELDAMSAEWEAARVRWQDALKTWGLSVGIADIGDNRFDDHPFRQAYEWDEDPNDYTRVRARDVHRTWRLRRAEAEQNQRARQAGGLSSQGLTTEAKSLLEELDQKDWDRQEVEYREAKVQQDLYVKCASLVVRSWKDRGADLRGIRLNDRGLLSSNSKAVRWFKSVCPKPDARSINRKAKQLAAKKKGWEKDLRRMRAIQ